MFRKGYVLINSCRHGRAMYSNTTQAAGANFETLNISVPKPFVYHVQLNRPEKRNALNHTMWIELGNCFDELSVNEDCRAIVLSGKGTVFSAGIDLNSMMKLGAELGGQEDVARRCKIISKKLRQYQNSLTSLEKCVKPVIGAVHGPCVGGGVDLIVATDIRYCSVDSWFQVKEVDIGMAADVGTLQRLPKVIGSDSLARELCLTARKFPATEALERGFVSKIFNNQESLISGALDLAEQLAEKSPVAIQGTKRSLVYSRDHSVQEGLDHIALWNQAMLQSEDFSNAVAAQLTKEKTTFSKL